VNISGGFLGTHRFQRAVSAGGALGNDGQSIRDCTLEAMRTQVNANQRFDCKVLLFAHASYFIVYRNIIAARGDMNYQDYITIEPGKRSGKPCIRGMRITVYDVLDYLASEMSIEEILDDFPELTREDILACLAFAADQGCKVMSVPA
jgi:uncharacterized protein (DUF433 family)